VERMPLREQNAPLPVRTLFARTLVIIVRDFGMESCSAHGAFFDAIKCKSRKTATAAALPASRASGIFSMG
jgi:hypothetical protein